MKFYDVKIRLGGSLLNEVWRHKVPAVEVHVLHAVHGVASIAEIVERNDIKPVKMSERLTRDERKRLEAIYGNTDYGKKCIDQLFGVHKSAELPETATMEDFAVIPEETDDFDGGGGVMAALDRAEPEGGASVLDG